MKKIVYVAKIVSGIVMVLAAAYSLSSFGGVPDLIFGALLMLAGVAIGVLLERRHGRLLFFLFIPSLLITLSAHFFPIFFLFQYFSGGLLIYFACALVFGRKKMLNSHIS